jgi:hypothetical protein
MFRVGEFKADIHCITRVSDAVLSQDFSINQDVVFDDRRNKNTASAFIASQFDSVLLIRRCGAKPASRVSKNIGTPMAKAISLRFISMARDQAVFL